jgi:glycolate oxidase iron-sulfur subunit
MQTRLAEEIRGRPEGREAEAILRSCVHCGFCAPTCPTYLLLGDELDGPRGRIYLIKQALEGETVTARTRLHLDRCLTCRACETACPSGVRYGRLLDIGRELVEERAPRPPFSRLLRAWLRSSLTSAWFAPAYRLAQALRPILPARLRRLVLAYRAPGAGPAARHARRVLLPAGCVQAGMAPAIGAASARVLDRIGVSVDAKSASGGCCGAIRQHLGDPEGARRAARRNVDAWEPALAAGAEAIVSNASGCGVMLKQYGELLAGDPAYAERAQRLSGSVRDLSEFLRGGAGLRLRPGAPRRLAVHAPCTLQHGQRLPGSVEAIVRALGAEPLPVRDAHLCCGSAGTYSLLQSGIARQLRDRKLEALLAGQPEAVLSANIGCIAHLGAAAPVPVRHWVEWLDENLA